MGAMKLSTTLTIALVATFAALGARPAAAASILIDHGAATYDPGTGLEWLDLTATAGQSVSDVSGGFGGYIAAGWQFATQAQVSQLFAHAGATGTYPEINSTPTSNPTYEAATILLSLLGATQPNTAGGGITGGSSTGLAGDGFGNFKPVINFTGEYTPFGPAYIGVFLSQGYLPDTNHDAAVGSFLVRTATTAVTPIPGALPLFLTALGAVGFLARRKRRSA
jgi:hypothetical protein